MAGLAFGSVFVVFVIGSVVALVRSDRKRAFHHGRTDRVGVGGAVAPVVALLPRDSAVRIAQEAVRRAGGKKVETVNGSVVVGWMGNPWTNLPKRSEYELAVSVSMLPDGSTQFMCSGRPRFGSQITGSARSQELASQLASEVVRLTEP